MTKEKSGWTLKHKTWSWSGRDYTIVDDQSKPAFNVNGKVLSLRGGMLFLDPKGGKPVAYLQKCYEKKLLTFMTIWKLFTFSPNFEGQGVTCKTKVAQTEVPIYQYARIEAKIASLCVKMRFKRYVSNEETEDVWEAKVKCSLKFKLDVRKADTKEVVAQLGQTAFFQFAPKYSIQAAKGVDRLSLIAFAIACENIIMEGQYAVGQYAGR